jgi:transposase-like protein
MNITRIHSEWSTASAIAKKHGVTERTVYRWVKSGKLESRTDTTGVSYRVTDTKMSGHPMSVMSVPLTEMSVVLARLEEMESHMAQLKLKVAELEVVRDELTIRLESIEHAHDWHVAVDGILEKRRKKLARLTRSLG